MYTNESHIKTVKDVEAFFHYLVEDRNMTIHPDDDFADYIDSSTHLPFFTAEEATFFNRLMDEAFEVCEASDADIYWISFQELKKKIDKRIG